MTSNQKSQNRHGLMAIEDPIDQTLPGSVAAILLERAKNAGRSARHADEPSTSPYPDGPMHTAWVAGWNEIDTAIREQPDA